MAKPTSPLFSIEAHGTLAGELTYGRTKNRLFVKKKPVPSQPRTGLQIAQRVMFAELQKSWPGFSDAEKDTWTVPAKAANVSKNNAFLKYNLIRWRNFLMPTIEFPAAETGTDTTYSGITFTGFVNHAIYVNNMSPIREHWMILFFRGPTGVIVPARDNLVGTSTRRTAGPTEWIDTPLAAGGYTYTFFVATTTGKLFDYRTDQRNVTVT